MVLNYWTGFKKKYFYENSDDSKNETLFKLNCCIWNVLQTKNEISIKRHEDIEESSKELLHIWRTLAQSSLLKTQYHNNKLWTYDQNAPRRRRSYTCKNKNVWNYKKNLIFWTPYPPNLIKHLKHYYSNETSNKDLRFDYLIVKKLKKILFNNMKHQNWNSHKCPTMIN